MQKLLAALTVVAFSFALVGCGGETPQPATTAPDTDLGAAGEINTMESGSDSGASGALPPALESPPATEPAPAGDQPAVEGETSSAEGPALPDTDK